MKGRAAKEMSTLRPPTIIAGTCPWPELRPKARVDPERRFTLRPEGRSVRLSSRRSLGVAEWVNVSKNIFRLLIHIDTGLPYDKRGHPFGAVGLRSILQVVGDIFLSQDNKFLRHF